MLLYTLSSNHNIRYFCAFSEGNVPKNPALALAYWAATVASQTTDGQALYDDLERYASHLQRLRKDTNSDKR